MPRTYVAKRLLEHGPLTFAEFREITGWPERSCESVLKNLLLSGVATFLEEWGSRRRVYQLA